MAGHKGCFSKALKQENVWQPRFWEHAIRDEEDYRRHIDYTYINPVKHGWVRQVCDWPFFSTFHRDAGAGYIPIIGVAKFTIFCAANAR